MLVLLVFLFGVGVVVGGYYALTKLPAYLQERQLSARLEEVTAIEAPKDESAEALVKTRHEGPLPVLDRLATGTAKGSALAAWVEQSGARISMSALLLVAFVCALVCSFIAGSALRLGIGWMIGGFAGFMLPFLVLRVKRSRRLRTFEEAFVRAALVRSGGHRGRAAADLGVTRQGLTKLLTRLGIGE